MYQKVLREIAGRRKGLAACVAREGLVARVHPKVRSEITGRREGLAACVAREGLVARNQQFVLCLYPSLAVYDLGVHSLHRATTGAVS